MQFQKGEVHNPRSRPKGASPVLAIGYAPMIAALSARISPPSSMTPACRHAVGGRALAGPFRHGNPGRIGRVMHVWSGGRGAGGCGPRPESGARRAAQPVTVGQAAGRSGRDPQHVALSSHAAANPPMLLFFLS